MAAASTDTAGIRAAKPVGSKSTFMSVVIATTMARMLVKSVCQNSDVCVPGLGVVADVGVSGMGMTFDGCRIDCSIAHGLVPGPMDGVSTLTSAGSTHPGLEQYVRARGAASAGLSLVHD